MGPSNAGDDPGRVAISASLTVHCQQDGGPVTMPLGDWISAMDGAVGRLSDDLAQVTDAVADLPGVREAAHRTQQALQQLTERADSADRRVTELDLRLNDVLAAVSELALGGRHGEADLDHYQFRRAFSTLVTQDVGMLVDTIAARCQLSERDRAILTSRICWLLFGTAEPLKDALMQIISAVDPEMLDSAMSVLDGAKELRDRMNGRADQHWDFGFQVGSPIDPELQEEWSPLPGSGEVEFVVVPSYVVGGYSILSKQRVYTHRSRGRTV